MKRKLLYLLIIFLAICIFPSYADEWAEFSGADHYWDGQKSITNKEFEDAINVLEGKKKQKEAKQHKKKIKKISGGGESLHTYMNALNEIPAQDELKKKDEEGQLLNVPVRLIIGDNILDTGFYNVYGKKEKNGEIYLSFYQSHFFKGKIKAGETDDDCNSDDINFVKLIPYNEDFVKIVFGSLDFNAYVFVKCQQDI